MTHLSSVEAKHQQTGTCIELAHKDLLGKRGPQVSVCDTLNTVRLVGKDAGLLQGSSN